MTLLLLVLLSLPLCWLSHKNIMLSQWILIGIAVTALFSLQPWYTLSLLVFLSLQYRFGIRLATFQKYNFHSF